ncbi:MAG: D-alanyl-D-alanine carboxypeptidase, partial [Gemmatimonadales bacterium]
MIRKDGKEGRDGKDGEVWSHGGRLQRGLTWLLWLLSAFVAVVPVDPVLAQADFARRIDARLNTVPFNRQLWGIALLDQNGRLVYGRNESRLFIPASNTKLIVSAVASALLSPDWRVKTSVYGGPVVGG